MHDLRVFWPQNAAGNGTVIGWLHEKVAVVAAVVENEVRSYVTWCTSRIHSLYKDAVDVEGHLRVYEKWLELKEDCQGTPMILGVVGSSNEGVISIRFKDEGLNHARQVI
jgi:hypothetical protein